MLIGKDFDKIETNIFGFKFLEINALYGDTLIFIVALIFAYKVSKLGQKSHFFKYWKWFFIVFGIGFFMGGLGHSFFNYWGVPGKYASWLIGIVAVLFIELAMISIFPTVSNRKTLVQFAVLKLFVALGVEIILLSTLDLSVDPSKGLIVPTINSVIGLGLVLGGLAVHYQKKIGPSFRYLWLSTLVLIPNTAIQGMKINIHPYFDRNDFSHVLLIAGLFLYMKSINEYNKEVLALNA